MSEDFNACVKAQLLTYLPRAFEVVLNKHEEIITQDLSVKDAEVASDVSKAMKLSLEQQKAAKAVVSHLEALIKLAKMAMEDAGNQQAKPEDKKRLMEIIQQAQERVQANRAPKVFGDGGKDG